MQPFLQRAYHIYFSQARTYRYNGLRFIVLPGIFAPHLTFSTKLLLQLLEGKQLEGKTLLELGCGSGIIAAYAASRGALVTASDINPLALENANLNAQRIQQPVKTVQSDLFTSLPNTPFDYIIINPPYYPKKPKNAAELAWFCGEDFDYFKRLFSQLARRESPRNTYLILSEDCNLSYIAKLAEADGLHLMLQHTYQNFWEKNYLYHIS